MRSILAAAKAEQIERFVQSGVARVDSRRRRPMIAVTEHAQSRMSSESAHPSA